MRWCKTHNHDAMGNYCCLWSSLSGCEVVDAADLIAQALGEFFIEDPQVFADTAAYVVEALEGAGDET